MGIRSWQIGGINYSARERVIDVEAKDVTTDPEEGRRQIEAMQPPKLKVGDKVRLAAGGERVMTVMGFEDYGNVVLCAPSQGPIKDGAVVVYEAGDIFPVRSLVLVEEPANIAG